MKIIQVFSETEELIITETKKLLLNSGDIDETKILEETLLSLEMLAQSISHYPSLLNRQVLGKHSRSLETLVQNLCTRSGLNLLLNTPTKAILGRGFTIAKMNFFILISYVCADFLHLCSGKDNIRKVISLNVFSIMAEDVFISIISDENIDIGIRTKAGFLLAKIWEFRIYKGIEELEPVLTDLWISRQSFIPSFGTMQGITEITTFCATRNPMWINFLGNSEFNEDTLDALKEYLMGLSYEEMIKIEDYMESKSISSFNITDVDTILEKSKSYPMNDYYDPREMYHFYVRRKDNANFREKSCMRGPKSTIEKYIICYMLKHGIIADNGN